MKKCSKCNKEKSVEEFHKDKYNKDGYKSACKECASKTSRESQKKSRECNMKREDSEIPYPTEKLCYICKKVVPIDAFVKDKGKNDGLANLCKKCLASKSNDGYYKHHRKRLARVKKDRDINKARADIEILIPDTKYCKSCDNTFPADKFSIDRRSKIGLSAYCKDCNNTIATKNRRDNVMRFYGLEPSDFDELLKIQGNKCSICGGDISKPQIDHDHSTGKIRGILCSKCNIGLGHFKDNEKALQSAIEYLKHPPALKL